MQSEVNIGFIRGVAYAAALMKGYQVDSEQLLLESGISEAELLEYADEHDLKLLGLIEED